MEQQKLLAVPPPPQKKRAGIENPEVILVQVSQHKYCVAVHLDGPLTSYSRKAQKHSKPYRLFNTITTPKRWDEALWLYVIYTDRGGADVPTQDQG